MHNGVRRCVSLLLLSTMLLTAAGPAAGADSRAGAGWSDGEEGFAVRVVSYGGEVSRVTAGERFRVQFWIKGMDPAAVSIPLSWDPAVAAVVDENTGEPVSTGRKTESDLVRGAGFRPGEACYDNSLNDAYEALYWNGKPVFARGDGTGASGYPYINNETGFAKFLYYTNAPTAGTEEQMFLEVYFKALAPGDPGLHFATAADGNSAEEYDPGSPRGMQVSYVDKTDGNIDQMDRVESETCTEKVPFPAFRVTDGSEMENRPVVPPATLNPGGTPSGGGGTPQTGTGPQPEEPAKEAVLIQTQRPDCWPYGETETCTAQIRRGADGVIWETDEYEVAESVLYGQGKTETLLVKMPEQRIDKEEYAVNLPGAPLTAQAGGGMVYLETPYGYVGLGREAVRGKLKTGSWLRVSVKPAKETGGNSRALTVSLQIDGAEAGGLGSPALRLILPWKAEEPDSGTAPVAMTDRAFGYTGTPAPLAVSRWDREHEALLVQAPAGGTITVEERAEQRFHDLDSVPWAQADIGRLAQLGIVSGTGEGRFRPEEAVSREQFAKMAVAALSLYEGGGSMPFADIQRSNPFYAYIGSAYRKGIVSGTGPERFGGEERISRQDLALMVSRACEKAGIRLPQTETVAVFADDREIAGYAKDAVYALARAGIISGTGDGRFSPDGSATRAEAARILGAVQGMAEQQLL